MDIQVHEAASFGAAEAGKCFFAFCAKVRPSVRGRKNPLKLCCDRSGLLAQVTQGLGGSRMVRRDTPQHYCDGVQPIREFRKFALVLSIGGMFQSNPDCGLARRGAGGAENGLLGRSGPRSGSRQPALFNRIPHQLNAAVKAELVLRARLIGLDALGAELQHGCNCLVGVADHSQS
jgi:hypothetical protein